MGTLAVAIDKPVSEWTRVLLHEYNHLRQWIEDPEGCDEADVDTRFLWQWIDNKCELNHAMVIRVCSIAIEVELDCERRTVKMAEELGFNWDLKEYIRGANAYLYFYPVISKTGKWYTEAPYRVHEITSIMPAYFLADAETYFDIPEEVEQLIREKCMTPEEEIDG